MEAAELHSSLRRVGEKAEGVEQGLGKESSGTRSSPGHDNILFRISDCFNEGKHDLKVKSSPFSLKVKLDV